MIRPVSKAELINRTGTCVNNRYNDRHDPRGGLNDARLKESRDCSQVPISFRPFR